MPKQLERMAKHLGVVLGERKRLEKVEKKLVTTLNRALGTIGYRVVSVKGVAPVTRRRRRAQPATAVRRRRARRAKPAGRPRRRTTARRRRARAKK